MNSSFSLFVTLVRTTIWVTLASKRKWSVHRETLEKECILRTVRRSGSFRKGIEKDGLSKEERLKLEKGFPFFCILLNILFCLFCTPFSRRRFISGSTWFLCLLYFWIFVANSLQAVRQSSATFWIKKVRFLSFLFLNFIYLVSMLLLLSLPFVDLNFAWPVFSYGFRALPQSVPGFESQ